jgi:hypothetical protein
VTAAARKRLNGNHRSGSANSGIPSRKTALPSKAVDSDLGPATALICYFSAETPTPIGSNRGPAAPFTEQLSEYPAFGPKRLKSLLRASEQTIRLASAVEPGFVPVGGPTGVKLGTGF